MRFHEPVVNVIRRNNRQVDSNKSVINSTAASNQVTHENIFYIDNGNQNFSSEKCLQTLKSIIHEKDTEGVVAKSTKTNNFDSRDVNCATSLEAFLKFKADSSGCYFKNYLDTDSKSDLNENGDKNNVILIGTLKLTEDNLSRFVTTTTTAYDNCVTNHSYNQQNCLSNLQRTRRENLIKLDFSSMTKHEGPMHSNGDDSAGCSVESSPVDSLLDDQELISLSSSATDLSSPDTHNLQELTRYYPRGIINPNYPGFQEFAHTLAEHFIDHYNFEQQLSDSEISDDTDFNVLAYRSGNLVNVNIMSDSNNNNDNINNNADEAEERSAMPIDLNRNKNRQNTSLMLAHDYSMKADDGNVNLLMKSEPKVFCESKQLEHLVIEERVIEFSSEDEDEEFCNLSQAVEPQQMDFDDDDDLADLSVEDDTAIKNELESIDRDDDDFNENINCDLVTYLQQYELKIDPVTDEDINKLQTPDILVEHNNKLENGDDEEVIIVMEGSVCDDETKHPISLEARDFQPDIIKSIGDNNYERITDDNEFLSHAEHEIFNTEEKIINQVQTEMTVVAATKLVQLSFDSTTSSVVDIIGDFGKEIEKEIGLIVSGYLDTDKFAPTSPQTNEPIRPRKFEQSMYFNNTAEMVFDENKFIEHVKYFSKMGDAALSNAEERIALKNSLVRVDEQRETALIPTAIVKPKYQKLPFDERQLPIRGSTKTELWTESISTNQQTTITTTPRKVQKHLPKNQKSQRKLKSSAEICSDFIVNDKVAIYSNFRGDIECSDTQQNYNNSVAIVQPIKKVMDTNKSDEEKMSGIEKEEIDYSINSEASTAEPKNRKNSDGEISLTNESKEVARMSDYGNNNLNFFNRKCAERENISGGDEKRVVMDMKKKKLPKSRSDAFDVYNIETALPNIDMEAIECHLMAAAKEEEMKRRNDRESIRRRLALGEEDDYLAVAQQHRPNRKPNLQSRLQNGQNLQICFMNEAASDSESSDSETCPKLSQGMSRRKNVQQRSSSFINHRSTALNNNPYSSRPLSVAKSIMDQSERAERPVTLALNANNASDNNFFTHQARLQIEARMALAQAKDIAHMQMEFERQRQPMCPITELVHQTLEKVGMKVPPTKRRLSRQLLTNMNIAQLQIIINEFHSFIETLNETLVRFLMDRDDLSMRQDSLLIDIEDITRYLGEKEEVKLASPPQSVTQHLDPKKAAAQRTTVIRYQLYPPTFLQNYNNLHKKSLMVNGNGQSVITREKFDNRNRLHL